MHRLACTTINWHSSLKSRNKIIPETSQPRHVVCEKSLIHGEDYGLWTLKEFNVEYSASVLSPYNRSEFKND